MVFEEKDVYNVKLVDKVNPNHNSKVILSVPKPTKQMFSIRGIRQPKEDMEASSNRDNRVSQKFPAYQKFLEKMRNMAQIIPPSSSEQQPRSQTPVNDVKQSTTENQVEAPPIKKKRGGGKKAANQ